MKTAYLICAYHQPGQLKRLVESLTAPGVGFFIHIDARSPIEPFAEVLALPGVTVAHRQPIRWGGWSLVESALRLAALAVQQSYDRYHLLSGQDYPIRSNEELKSFFANDRIYLEHILLPTPSWGGDGGQARFKRYYFTDWSEGQPRAIAWAAERVLRALGKVYRRRPPMTVHGGSTWWSLTHEAMVYTLTFLDQHPHVTAFFSRTWIPDELLMQTVLLNSPLANKVVNDCQRFIDWSVPRGRGNPKTFEESDLVYIIDSGKSFARKFDGERHPRMIDAIESHRRSQNSYV